MNKHCLAALAVIILLTVLLPAGALADQPVKVLLDGESMNFDVPPVLEQGRVLVPLRPMVEALGKEAAWDPLKRMVTIIDTNNTVKLFVDSPIVYKGDREVKLDMPVTIKNGRTLAPIRFISEVLEARVEWQKEPKLVSIYREHNYLKSALNDCEYWLNTKSGDLYLLKNTAMLQKIGQLQLSIIGMGYMSAEQTPKGNVLLTVTDNFGEPGYNNIVYAVYLSDNKIAQRTMVHYYIWFKQNIKFYREYVVMTDGKKAYLVNDDTNEIEKTFDLVALGGQDDDYFIEWMEEDYVLIRPNQTGILMLINLKTKEKVLLYKELLSELEQKDVETNEVPYYGDGDHLKFIEAKNNVLYFKNNSNLQRDDKIYQYPLTNTSQQ